MDWWLPYLLVVALHVVGICLIVSGVRIQHKMRCFDIAFGVLDIVAGVLVWLAISL